MTTRGHALRVTLTLAAASCALLSACSSPVAPVQRPPAPTTSTVEPTGAPAPWPRIALVEVWKGLDTPVALTGARDGTRRVFIVEKAGRIRIATGGTVLPRPFLDISEQVSGASEQGLLGLAFPPDYGARPRFYVYYTDTVGDIRIARVGLTADPDVADARSVRTILRVAHPSFGNHNGGQLAFGPDGYLYAGIGDGGSAGDPSGHAQDLRTLLGKIVRLDVAADGPDYTVPTSNPFVGRSGARPEIWAYGLRNPWRFSFDRLTGDLWIGDVGQGDWEEIDLEPTAGAGGRNYGWRVYEGNHPYPPGSAIPPSDGLAFPVDEYPHATGRSVTGGYVYRGVAVPSMRGFYFFADYVDRQLFALRRTSDGWERTTLLETSAHITSFGEDDAGELYACDAGGSVYRIRTAP